MIPGEYILGQGDVPANVGRETTTVYVVNTGDRPIQVGSHYHFFETNKALAFDRALAYGMRLNIPSGNAVRFEPGERKTVNLVHFGGRGVIYGFHQLVKGALSAGDAQTAANAAYAAGFQAEYKTDPTN